MHAALERLEEIAAAGRASEGAVEAVRARFERELDRLQTQPGDAADERRRVKELRGRREIRLNVRCRTASVRVMAPPGSTNGMGQTISDQLVSYLRHAHGMELQSLRIVEKASSVAGHPRLERIYRAHAAETREHERLALGRLRVYGQGPSTAFDLGAQAAGLGLGLAASAVPDTPAATAIAAYSFESLEIVVWETIRRVAMRAGDSGTVAAAEQIVIDERLARDRIADQLDLAVDRALAEAAEAA